MSGWAFETDESLACDTRARPSGQRSKPRRAFFSGSGSDGEVDATPSGASRSDTKRDSLLVAPSRRSQRNNHAELVVDDSDDASPQDQESARTVKPVKMKVPATVTAPDSLHIPTRISVAVTNSATRCNGKSDEIATADVVRRASESLQQASEAVSSQYIHWLVRDFLEKKYPRTVVEMFDKENPVLAARAETHHAVQALHARIVAGVESAQSTSLEHVLVAWDTHVHHKQLTRPRSRRKESLATSDPSPTPEAKVAETKPKTRSSSGSRKKPQLSVAITSDIPPSPCSRGGGEGVQDDGEFNRLNHPGHTPKAQDALLAAVIGQPGSTPKASVGELRALGFEDIDDALAAEPLIPTPNKPLDAQDNDDGSDLSRYAQRKRALRRHDKHVSIGEPGKTPTKEYVFFRETPPRYVTETIDAAEDALRSIGGDPERGRRSQAATMERFVELQSSDVTKYAIGQRVTNLGAQRNVTGLVAKLYGSRQCGTAGPGTVVIDTWEGSDTAPMLLAEDELLSVATRPSTPASSR